MTRWYLTHATLPDGVFLVVEDEATAYGVMSRIDSRAEGRALLPDMRAELARRLARRNAAVRTFDAVEVDG